MKKFTDYVNSKRQLVEKENLQDEYQEVFQALLDKYEVDSPADLSDEDKSKFFNEISDHYKKGEGATKKGEDLVDKKED